MKRDADLFGSRHPIPPSCLITVWADISCNPKIRLRHPVILTGIDCNTRKIYISTFLETVESTNPAGMWDYHYHYAWKFNSYNYYIQNLLVIQDIHRTVIYHIKHLLIHLIQVRNITIYMYLYRYCVMKCYSQRLEINQNVQTPSNCRNSL